MPLPEEYTLFEFELGTVQYFPDLKKLYVQIMDAYSYQREWLLRCPTGVGDWTSHIYMHPQRRHLCDVKSRIAAALASKFLEQCRKHPDLLFNKHTEQRPRHSGFVHFAEQLHRGVSPNQSML